MRRREIFFSVLRLDVAENPKRNFGKRKNPKIFSLNLKEPESQLFEQKMQRRKF